MNAEQIFEVIMRREFDATDYSELDDVMLFRSDDFSQTIKKAAAAITKKLAEKTTTTEPPEPPKTVLPDMSDAKYGIITYSLQRTVKRWSIGEPLCPILHVGVWTGTIGGLLPIGSSRLFPILGVCVKQLSRWRNETRTAHDPDHDAHAGDAHRVRFARLEQWQS